MDLVSAIDIQQYKIIFFSQGFRIEFYLTDTFKDWKWWKGGGWYVESKCEEGVHQEDDGQSTSAINPQGSNRR